MQNPDLVLSAFYPVNSYAGTSRFACTFMSAATGIGVPVHRVDDRDIEDLVSVREPLFHVTGVHRLADTRARLDVSGVYPRGLHAMSLALALEGM